MLRILVHGLSALPSRASARNRLRGLADLSTSTQRSPNAEGRAVRARRLHTADGRGETSAAASPAFASHPLNRAEILRPYAGEAVALQNVAEFVFAEHVGPDVR